MGDEQNKTGKRKLPTWMVGKAKVKTDETEKKKTCKSAGELLCLPELKFPGKIIYSCQKNDCLALCEQINEDLSNLSAEERVLGFDMEWPVTFMKGAGSGKTALIQICGSQQTCYLFHVSCMEGVPKGLASLLKNPDIKLSGVGIESDLWKLDKDYDVSAVDIIKQSMVDLTPLANKVLKSKENWSLDNLCQRVLGRRLNKDPSIRTCDWSEYPLSDVKMMYAATDAYASWLLYKEIKKREEKPS